MHGWKSSLCVHEQYSEVYFNGQHVETQSYYIFAVNTDWRSYSIFAVSCCVEMPIAFSLVCSLIRQSDHPWSTFLYKFHLLCWFTWHVCYSQNWDKNLWKWNRETTDFERETRSILSLVQWSKTFRPQRAFSCKYKTDHDIGMVHICNWRRPFGPKCFASLSKFTTWFILKKSIPLFHIWTW